MFLRELPASERPFRFRCQACEKRFKLLNGFNADAFDRMLSARLGEGRIR